MTEYVITEFTRNVHYVARGMDTAVVVSLVFHSVLAQNLTNGSTIITPVHKFTSDPLLQYKPQFAHSLPVQLLMTGVVLTLATTLLIQLCFTWQYHWPLARVNWILQFTAVCTLLTNILAILFVTLTTLAEKGTEWPYMFDYIAIDVPRIGFWTIPEIAAWYVMEACTSALASITHIQFLTFLYPSRLEARLVFLLLGPLAIVASIMTLLPISAYTSTSFIYLSSNHTRNGTSTHNGTNPGSHGHHNASIPSSSLNISIHQQQLYDIIDASRNICNLTLSLLFTLSLLIWGFFVNRNSAWRTDGGTAAFGAGALFLALVSTGLNLLTVISSPRFEWLPTLLWSVVLWQSFLGWWWWVGSASGIAAREFDMETQGRKDQKRAKRKRRKVGSKEDIFVGNSLGNATARLDRWKSSVGMTLARRRPAGNAQISASQSQTSTLQGESIELVTLSSINSVPGDSQPHDGTKFSPPVPRSPLHSIRIFPAVQQAWRSLRQAHVRAARVQAIEHQIQIQMQLENGHGLGRFPGGTGGERPLSAMRVVNSEGASDEGSPPNSRGNTNVRNHQYHESASGSTMWWWGPLKRWRLRDSTTY